MEPQHEQQASSARLEGVSGNAQAQTVANFFLAFEQDLAIVPVLNKVDLPAAEPQRVAEQMQQVRLAGCLPQMSSPPLWPAWKQPWKYSLIFFRRLLCVCCYPYACLQAMSTPMQQTRLLQPSTSAGAGV